MGCHHRLASARALAAAAVLLLPARALGAEEAEPPSALLVPAGPAYPIEPLADAAPTAAPPVVELPAPRITAITEVPAPVAEPGGPPPVATPIEPEGPPGELTPSQREALRFQMRSYLRQVHERIGAAWAAPVAIGPMPRRHALVTVVIARDGRVLDARIDRSSRDASFDRSALRTLGQPHLFPPLPPYYETDALEVGLRFADPARR